MKSEWTPEKIKAAMKRLEDNKKKKYESQKRKGTLKTRSIRGINRFIG